MCALPIVAGSEVSTPSSGVQISPEAFRNAALAKGRLGSAIGGGVGDFLQSVTDNIMAARNAKKVADADLTMSKAHADFVTRLSKDPELRADPDKWLPAYNEVTAATKDQILNQQDLSPVAKRHISGMVDAWKQSSTAAVNTSALKRENADATESLTMAATNAYDNQLQQDGDRYVNSMVELGLIGPKVGAMKKKLGHEQMVQAQATNLIADAQMNPDNAVRAPENFEAQFKGKLPAAKYKTGLFEAERARNTAQTANMYEAVDRIATGQSYDEDQIAALKQNKKISDRGATSIIFAQKQHTKQELEGVAGDALSRANDYADGNDKNADEMADIQTEAAKFKNSMPQAYERIQRLLKDGKKGGKVGDDGYHVIDQAFNDRIFGDWELPVYGAKGEKLAREKPDYDIREKAAAIRYELQNDLDDWKGKNADASRHDERAYAQEITKKYVVAAAAAVISGEATKTLTAKDHEAYQWAAENPTDPKSKLIFDRIAATYGTK